MPQHKFNNKILIVGQGITGTFLSWYLEAAGVNYRVIDKWMPDSPSRVAAGIINPVTGRRVVKVWMDDVLLPFAVNAYNEMGDFLNIPAISKKNIIDFFPNPFMKESFLKKLQQKEDYINIVEDKNFLAEYFKYEFGAGLISPAYTVHLDWLLPAWRSYLVQKGKLSGELFEFDLLHTKGDTLIYDGEDISKIIFCDGTIGAINPYFSLLPFALNKGEAIIIEAPLLLGNYIYKKSITLAPLSEKGVFWTGANYIWDFTDSLPTTAFLQATEAILKQWLKVPFKIIDHKAAIRPATVERRPFVGFHPKYKNIGIVNGMGTKGCSLAPYFTHQMVENILHSTPLLQDVSISRFEKILSKNI